MGKGLVLIIAAALLVAVPAAATAKPPKKAVVQEGVGVAGVNLGMTDKQAVAKWGKPNGGKCSVFPKNLGTCSWTADNHQIVNVFTVSHKIVSIGMMGTLWGTKKAKPGKTSYDQMAKLYPGIKIGYTCALDFGHVAILKKGKLVTVFATSNRTPSTAAFSQITILDYSKTGFGQIDKGTGLETRTECDPKNQPAPGAGAPGGGSNPGGTTPVRPQYTVFGSARGGGDGSVTATSSASDAQCSSSSCRVYTGSPVTLTASALSGSHFTGWTGDCSGTNSAFSFASVDADKSCTATFELDTP